MLQGLRWKPDPTFGPLRVASMDVGSLLLMPETMVMSVYEALDRALFVVPASSVCTLRGELTHTHPDLFSALPFRPNHTED